jgi:hypothetical protein
LLPATSPPRRRPSPHSTWTRAAANAAKRREKEIKTLVSRAMRACVVLVAASLVLGPLAAADATLNFSTVYEWFKVDFAWQSDGAKATALSLGRWVPEHCAPGGLAVLGSRLFVSVPRYLPGVPSTLNWLPSAGASSASPKLNPFPSWEMQVSSFFDFDYFSS